MTVVDAQVHVWEADSPGRPWDREALDRYLARTRLTGRELDGTEVVTYDDLLARMDAIGVDAAVLVTFGAYYPLDNSYALEAATAHPDRFAAVARLDHRATDVERQVEAVAAIRGTVGLRVIATTEEECAELRGGAHGRLLAAAQASGLAVFVYPPQCLDEIGRIATAFPSLRLVVDHLGMPQPPVPIPDGDPFRRLPELLELARFDNVAVKLSGLPSISREPFPFADLWPHLHRVLDAFGAERLLWGTDTTRTGMAYAEGLGWVRDSAELGEREKALVLGESLRRCLGWPAG
jgi:L-fuconolactonase